MRWIICILLLFGGLRAQDFKDHIHFSQTDENRVGYLYIGGHSTAITQGTLLYVQKAFEQFKENPPLFVILELDTPGGEVFSAQKISDLLKDLDTQYGIPVVAFINNWAISAGAMLAYSCRYITVVKDGVMGAAEPVTSGGEKTSEKVNSAIRADFGARAGFWGRNPLIAKAMVDPDMVLVWRSGEVVELKDNEEIKESDEVIIRSGKLLTLNSEEMKRYGVSDLMVEPAKVTGSLPLLFTAPFFKEIPNVKIEKVDLDWRDQIVLYLSQPAIAGFILTAMMICFYIELSTPGFGAFGAMGVLFLVLLVLPSIAMQLVTWFELLLLFIGIVLLGVELFVIPGFGFLGISGIVLILTGMVMLLIPALKEAQFSFDTHEFNAAGIHALNRFWWFIVSLLVSVGALAVIGRFIAPKIRLLSPLVLNKEQEQGSGFENPIEDLIGKEGATLTPLSPYGKVRIGSETYAAIAPGDYIERGIRIRIKGIDGNTVKVERMQ
jgi:membrane-bound serine protease (ClpP class)